MKTRLLTALCVVTLTFGATHSSFAQGSDSVAVAADALVARPLCFAATIVGSVVFLVALPVAATSKSVKKVAHALVVTSGQGHFHSAARGF